MMGVPDQKLRSNQESWSLPDKALQSEAPLSAALGGYMAICETRAGSINWGRAMSDEKGTVHLHRVIKAPPERVYKAFLDPGALERWLPPYGFTGKIHEMDARVGGGYRMSFTNFSTGSSHSFSVRYTELVAGQRIRHTDTFDDPDLPGEMLVSIDMKAVTCGTELDILQEGIPSSIPVEFCYLGWQESLKMLARVVEPDIPDNG